jgi:hypothetical protein
MNGWEYLWVRQEEGKGNPLPPPVREALLFVPHPIILNKNLINKVFR